MTSLVEQSARELESFVKWLDPSPLRQAYELDVFSMANIYLNAIGWNEVLFFSDPEWLEFSADLNPSVKLGDGATIPAWKSVYIKNSRSLSTQRFTLGHELGHVFLHRERITELSPQDEVDANAFARELLCPKHLARMWADENRHRIMVDGRNSDAMGWARRMAYDFNVSTKTSAKTLKTINFMPNKMEIIMQNKSVNLPLKSIDLIA